MVETQEPSQSDPNPPKVDGVISEASKESFKDPWDGTIEKNEWGMGEYEKKPLEILPETPNGERKTDETVRIKRTTSDVPPKRSQQKWTPSHEFTLTSLAYISSLASLWKFPEMILKHGGVFILPYTIAYLTVGIPLLHAEIALGQFTSCTHYGVFDHIAPILAGLSSCMTFILVIRSLVVSIIQATTLAFFLASFHSHQYDDGETTCTGSSHSPYCFNVDKIMDCMHDLSMMNTEECTKLERVSVLSGVVQLRRTPFFDHVLTEFNVLPQESSEFTWPHHLLFLSLVVVWLLTAIVCFIGIKALGKVAYLMATPILIFLFFMIFGFSTIPNSMDAFAAFDFNWDKLKRFDSMWTDAVSIVVFSLNLGNGGLIKLASHNDFHRSFTKDVYIISAYGYFFNYFTTLTILPYIYYIAIEIYGNDATRAMQMWVDHGDFGLMNVIAETITSRHAAGWLCALYFFACFILEFQSTSISMHVVYTSLLDRIDSSIPRLLTIIILCGGTLFASFFLITPGGIYAIHQLDRFFTLATIFISLIQVSALICLYTLNRFICNICTMIGGKAPKSTFWWISLLVIAPIVLLSALIMEFIYYSWEDISIGNTVLTTTFKNFSSIIFVCCIFWFPLVVIFRFKRSFFTNDRMKNLFRPTPEWGPRDKPDRECVAFNERAMRAR